MVFLFLCPAPTLALFLKPPCSCVLVGVAHGDSSVKTFQVPLKCHSCQFSFHSYHIIVALTSVPGLPGPFTLSGGDRAWAERALLFWARPPPVRGERRPVGSASLGNNHKVVMEAPFCPKSFTTGLATVPTTASTHCHESEIPQARERGPELGRGGGGGREDASVSLSVCRFCVWTMKPQMF